MEAHKINAVSLRTKKNANLQGTTTSGHGEAMRRREFIGLLCGAAGALTCADLFAAQKSPIARTGLLCIAPLPSDPECNSDRRENYGAPVNCWLSDDLRAFGWREGENLQIEIRSSNGDLASLPRLAAELVALRPDVLIAVGSQEAKALQAATSAAARHVPT